MTGQKSENRGILLRPLPIQGNCHVATQNMSQSLPLLLLKTDTSHKDFCLNFFNNFIHYSQP